MKKKFFASLVLAVISAVAVANPWSYHGPKRDIVSLVVTANYEKPRLIAELIQVESRQPFLLLPARNEATGTVIVEAVSSGAPVIASGECGYAKYAALAGSTVLPEPWQDSAFPRAIEELYLDRERALRHAVEYSSTVNYTQRADRTIDLMEDFAK
jgi:glycosyltransferase involved in cell wall biosynthesis